MEHRKNYAALVVPLPVRCASIASSRARSSPSSLIGPTFAKIALHAFNAIDSVSEFINSISLSTAFVVASVSLPTAAAVTCARISETRSLNSMDRDS